jgi:hypothetical protein
MNSWCAAGWIVLAGVLGHVLVGHAALPYSAADDADNAPYPGDDSFEADQNGGTGFLPWQILDLRPFVPYAGTRYLLQPGLTGAYEDGNSWGLSGGYAMARSLAGPPARRGTWSFVAAHTIATPLNSHFSGFSLKSGMGESFGDYELIRFGFNPQATYPPASYPASGLWVSTDGGENYSFLDCGWQGDPSGVVLEYSISWEGDGHYVLSVYNSSEDSRARFSTALDSSLPHMPVGSVTTLGAAIYGSTLNETLAFDTFAVSYIPEPAHAAFAVACLALVFALGRAGGMRSSG